MKYTNYKLQTTTPMQSNLINAGYTAEHWTKGCHTIYLAGYHGHTLVTPSVTPYNPSAQLNGQCSKTSEDI